MLSSGLLPKAVVAPTNPYNDFEVAQSPDNSICALEFSPAALQQDLLVAGSWDKSVRCWEVEQNGKIVLKSMQSMTLPIVDVCWSDDGTKVFMATCFKQVKCWDLGSNQTIQVVAHDAMIKTCHWVKAPSYTCLMTTSWDKTLKFWDVRSSSPIMTINLPQQVYCADVDYPMAVIGTASRGIFVYKLEGKPEFVKNVDSPLKHQHQCVSIFRDKEKQLPCGFGLGSVEGRVAIHYMQPESSKDDYTFKCHGQNNTGAGSIEDIFYAVNDMKFHPVHGTLATVGSDRTFAFWDKDAQTKLKSSEIFDRSPTKCCFNSTGQIFAYGLGFDRSKGDESNNPVKKPYIFLKPCFEDLKPKSCN